MEALHFPPHPMTGHHIMLSHTLSIHPPPRPVAPICLIFSCGAAPVRPPCHRNKGPFPTAGVLLPTRVVRKPARHTAASHASPCRYTCGTTGPRGSGDRGMGGAEQSGAASDGMLSTIQQCSMITDVGSAAPLWHCAAVPLFHPAISLYLC